MPSSPPHNGGSGLQLTKKVAPATSIVTIATPPALGNSTSVGARINYDASAAGSMAAGAGAVKGAAMGREAPSASGDQKNDVVDFIGPSDAVKHLFSLPYSNDRNVSVALHNIGDGTLLLDSGEDDFINFNGAEGRDGNSFVPSPGNIRRMRRQRPSTWSLNEEFDDTDGESNRGENDEQLREGEKTLLASLSLLLEEEKQQQRKLQQLQLKNDSQDTFSEEGGSEQQNKGGLVPVVSRDEQDPQQSNALVVHPSTSLVVGAANDISPSFKSQHANTTAKPDAKAISAHSSSGSTTPIAMAAKALNRSNDDKNNNDVLAPKLPPPQHYLRHVVSPPAEPRQYVDWEFHGNKMLIASNALVYDQNNETTESSSSAEPIAIRVADVNDLKSQMRLYNESLDLSHDGILEGDHREQQRSALAPSSYAEALKLSRQRKGGGDDDDKHDEEDLNDNLRLQTCIIPTSGSIGPEWAQLGFSVSPFPGSAHPNNSTTEMGTDQVSSSCNDPSATSSRGEGTNHGSNPSTHLPPSKNSAPVCTVMDAYLDNLMANVPQLALILREHGFVQNIKLMHTEDIPSLMMHPSTLGDDAMPSSNSSAPSPIFDRDIVEMNASMLLRFLKTNCTRENSTYLLRRAANTTEIQLFNISSLTEPRLQRKWVWWLALCSYRFACRLEQLQTSSCLNDVARREYRARQRSLLHNTLNLLGELADMDNDGTSARSGGSVGRHETINAAVCEHLADTYLWSDGEMLDRDKKDSKVDGDSSTAAAPSPCASSSQPYRYITVDCLDKAHDHLVNGIKKLTPLLLKANRDEASMEVEAISTQLYGIYHKLINVNLRLADHHLKNYFSSNLIQSLRMAARTLADATKLLVSLLDASKKDTESNAYGRSILLQYAWLFEYCGHFARSFAADSLWRDRGHTCGADLIGLFREVNASCECVRKECYRIGESQFGATNSKPKTTSVIAASHGQISLDSLSGIVILPHDFEQIEASVLQKEGCHEAIGAAKVILDSKTEIKRDARLVLVAASVCYGHAIDSHVFLAEQNANDNDAGGVKPGRIISVTPDGDDPFVAAPLLRQRLGDACNELGKLLLEESRTVLLPQFTPPRDDMMGTLSHVSAIMLASSQFWFQEGLSQFTEGGDLRNIALLRCNLCQVCKIRANTNVILPGSGSGNASKKQNNSETYLQHAVDHLVAAHDSMGEREADPITWDMVSEELAATLLVLGVRRRQATLSSSSPEPLMLQALRLTPGDEKAIVEPMEKSAQIYESLGTARASHQAAAANYQLALYFSKVWTCQRDEGRTREKLSAAFRHYGQSYQYFFQHVKGNETTFVVLALDFSNLYSAVSGEEEPLLKALLLCVDTRVAFTPLPTATAGATAPATMEQLTTLADNVEARVSKLLLSLVKIEKERKTTRTHSYKDMYRGVLQYKILKDNEAKCQQDGCNSGDPHHTFPIFGLLQTLSEKLNV